MNVKTAKEEEKTTPQPETSGTKKEVKLSRGKRFSRYLRELSVVVIGVAVTFTGTAIINHLQERNKLRRHMEAIKIEIRDNLALFREGEEYYRGLARLTRYLNSDRPENLSPDSVFRLDYNGETHLIGRFFGMPCKTSAFEMLKSSGSLNLIGEQKLFRSILDSYVSMDRAKTENDRYMSRKIDELQTAIMDNEQVFYGDILNPKFRRIFYFFAASFDMALVFRECAEQMEKTLLLIEKDFPDKEKPAGEKEEIE